MALDPALKRGSRESFERVHHQARVQVASRDEARPVVEILDTKDLMQRGYL